MVLDVEWYEEFGLRTVIVRGQWTVSHDHMSDANIADNQMCVVFCWASAGR